MTVQVGWLPGVLFFLDILAKHYELRNSIEARCTKVYESVTDAVCRVGEDLDKKDSGIRHRIDLEFGEVYSMKFWRKQMSRLHSRVYVSQDLLHTALTAPAARSDTNDIELKNPKKRYRFQNDDSCNQDDTHGGEKYNKKVSELLMPKMEEVKLTSDSKLIRAVHSLASPIS